jgi:hypothetical protein
VSVQAAALVEGPLAEAILSTAKLHDDGAEDADTAEAGAPAGKKREKKQKEVVADLQTGWTHPPSQPPPAN